MLKYSRNGFKSTFVSAHEHTHTQAHALTSTFTHAVSHLLHDLFSTQSHSLPLWSLVFLKRNAERDPHQAGDSQSCCCSEKSLEDARETRSSVEQNWQWSILCSQGQRSQVGRIIYSGGTTWSSTGPSSDNMMKASDFFLPMQRNT